MAILALFASAGGKYVWEKRSARKQLLAHQQQDYQTISQWAADNQWSVRDTTHLEQLDTVQTVISLLGEPGDEEAFTTNITKGNSRFTPKTTRHVHWIPWDIGTIVSKQLPQGPILHFSAWHQEDWTFHFFSALRVHKTHAAISTAATENFTVDWVSRGQGAPLQQTTGQPPEVSWIGDSLQKQNLPTRLRLLAGWLIVRQSRRMTVEGIAERTHMLTKVFKNIRSAPQKGPLA